MLSPSAHRPPPTLKHNESPFAHTGYMSAGSYNKLIQMLRAEGVQTELNLPRVVVIGNQSSGKSSLVEAISGINVPRDAGTCTRCPMELRLASSDEPWTCKISIRWEHDASGRRLSNVREVPFGKPFHDKSDVDVMLRRAQAAVLNQQHKDIDLDYYLEKSDEDIKMLSDKATRKFSRNVICVDLAGPGLDDLSFVDLPGIIQNDTDGQGEVKLVEDLARSYIASSNTLILVVLPMTDDIQNQKAAQLAREVDPNGERTIGVLTKPDAIAEGSIGVKRNYSNVLEGKAHQTRHGYYCTRQPDDAERAQNITHAEARDAEDKFFAECEPWATSAHRHRLGTRKLVAAISELLTTLIRADVPRIQRELLEQRVECERQLEGLPPRTAEPVSDVISITGAFADVVVKVIEGSPEHTALVQAIMQLYDMFTAAVEASVPQFVPTPAASDSPGPSGMAHALSLDDVRARIQQSITRELPNHVPYAVKCSFISAFQGDWETFVRECFSEVAETLKHKLMSLVDGHFDRFSNLKRSVRSVVLDLIDAHAVETKAQLNHVLAYERNPPATRFTGLLSTYRSIYKDQYQQQYTNACQAQTGIPAAPRLASQREFTFVCPKPSLTTSGASADGGPGANRGNSNAQVLFGAPGASASRLVPKREAATSDTSSASQPRQVASHDKSASASFARQPEAQTEKPQVAAYEEELALMAEIRAYFDISSTRFVDYVTFAIDHHLLYAFSRGLRHALVQKLGLAGGDAAARCERYLLEDPDVAAMREDLVAKKERLDKVHKGLYEFGL